tara:strand:- start:1616 stop:1981 length:366 start_codon:yes stop_codon:yes gene_type:complete
MKTYNQFVSESYSARENIQEALITVPLAIKGALWANAGWNAYQAAKKLKRGDYKGAALDGAAAIPVGGAAFQGARALGVTRNLSKGVSGLASGAKWTGYIGADMRNTKNIRTLDKSKYQSK